MSNAHNAGRGLPPNLGTVLASLSFNTLVRAVRLVGLAILTVTTPAAAAINQDVPTASTDCRLSAQDVSAYRLIAYRILERIAALKARYPLLHSIATDAHVEDAKGRLWIAYHYSHGTSLVKNPDYVAGKKISPTVKRFSNDGVELNLYFFEGAWPGQAIVLPDMIGDMKIVIIIEGRETHSLATLRGSINEIIRNEQAMFQAKLRASPNNPCS